jgi:hypothetical protein
MRGIVLPTEDEVEVPGRTRRAAPRAGYDVARQVAAEAISAHGHVEHDLWYHHPAAAPS